MISQPVHKKDPARVLSEYPITGLIEGWFFRHEETSNGVFLVEGTDLWGRRVSRQGGNLDELISQCSEDALRLSEKVNALVP